jgi:hypothetical protein
MTGSRHPEEPDVPATTQLAIRLASSRPLVLAAALSLAALHPAAGRAGDSRIEGTIRDAAGRPVAECRVVARSAEGAEVYVSPPSDDRGRYGLPVPGPGAYRIVALVAPTGARVALPEEEPVSVDGAATARDLVLPLPAAPQPRTAAEEQGGVDRLFLSFVEDPAMVRRYYGEAQLDGADLETADRYGLRLVGAIQFPSLPRVELGGRGGWASLEPELGASESGAVDLDLWGKFHLLRSASTRWDLAVGALLTLPTGDEDKGLGDDAIQSKLFAAASYTLPSAVLIGHAAARTTGDGEVAGAARDGQVSAAAGFGAVVAFSPEFSLVFEANYDGERFDGADDESRVLFGANWAPWTHGQLRAAIAGGLTDASPDAAVLVGYAVRY